MRGLDNWLQVGVIGAWWVSRGKWPGTAFCRITFRASEWTRREIVRMIVPSWRAQRSRHAQSCDLLSYDSRLLALIGRVAQQGPRQPKTATDRHWTARSGMTTRGIWREWQNVDAKNWEKGVLSPHPLFFFLLAAPITGHPTCQLSQLPCRWLTVFMQVSRAPAFFISRLFATRRFRAIGTVLGGHAVTDQWAADRPV